MAMYDSSNTVEKSFDLDYISESLLQAQWSEFIELKKVIHDVFLKKGAPSRILDIGVGNARVPLHLAGIKEIWDMIERYHGTDNALACVEIAQENARNARIANKLSIQLLDATQLAELASEYDLIACTWFTPGNFYPDEFSFSSSKAGIAMPDLSHNEKFELVFGTAYKLLKAGGTLLLGACYLDNDATRLKQEESYLKMG